jgi:hypothetical protein
LVHKGVFWVVRGDVHGRVEFGVVVVVVVR